MNSNLKKVYKAVALFVIVLLGSACQKMDRPALGDFPADANPPGGPLNFFVAFDGTSGNPLMNAVDSTRATFPSDNPLTSIDGVSGKAVQGANKKFIKFTKPNDWAIVSKSFSISVWYKRDGQTQNNTGGNGPEYLASFKANNGHWSGSSLLLFLEGNNAACAVKVMVADKNNADNWFTWEGGSTIAGIMNNQWQHIVITYDAVSSAMTLFVNGVANPDKRNWGSHGNINIDDSKIQEVRIGAGPNNSFDTDDWLSSTFKGGIDQFRMYSSVLTPAEIQSLFVGKK